jgi:cation diffusion facilitator family transporter
MTHTHVPRPDRLDAHARRAAIARMLWIILWLNLAVAAAKLIYGRLSGALAISADGLHSLIDASSNVLGLVGVSLARRPPDANHPYGHRKYETVAALGVAGMLFLGCREIAGEAIARLRDPQPPHVSASALLVMVATLAVNLLVVRIERREGRRLDSELLLSDAAHTQSDVWATVLVIASIGLQRLGLAWADLAVTVVIMALVVRAGLGILRATLPTLSDERRLPPLVVEYAAAEVPGVIEVHNVRSRGPADDVYVDLHVLVDPDARLEDAHALGHAVDRLLRDRFPGVTDVVVHVEPALDTERATERKHGGLHAEG